MDQESKLKKLTEGLPDPKPKTRHGQWMNYAYDIAEMVKQGYTITESTKKVMEVYQIDEQYFQSIRVAYYNLRNRLNKEAAAGEPSPRPNP